MAVNLVKVCATVAKICDRCNINDGRRVTTHFHGLYGPMCLACQAACGGVHADA